MRKIHLITENNTIRDLSDLTLVVNKNADVCAKHMNTLHTRTRVLNNRTNLLIFVGAVVAYKAYRKIVSLENEIKELKENKDAEYWAAEFERMDTKAATEGEPDVT